MSSADQPWTKSGAKSLYRLFAQRQRRVSESGAHAFIEIRIPEAEQFAVFASALEDKLHSAQGVTWAEVQPAVRRVMVAFDQDRCELESLVEVVEAVEQAHGLDGRALPIDVEDHPADDEPLLRNTAQIMAALSGALVAVLVKTRRKDPSRVHLDLRELVSLVKNTPKLRTTLEDRLGLGRTDKLLTYGSTFLHATSGGVGRLMYRAVYRLAQRMELKAQREAWEHRKVELCTGSRRRQRRPSLATRPVPLPPGPIEKYAEGAWSLSLGGFAVGIADTQALSSALAPLVDAAPKPAQRGRELFATQLGCVLAKKGIICQQKSVLRRLDRIDTVVMDARMLLQGARAIAKISPLDTVGLQEIRQRAGQLFDGQHPSATQQCNGWKLSPWEQGAGGDGTLGLTLEDKLVARIETVPALDPAVRDLISALVRAELSLVLAADGDIDVSLLNPDQVIAPSEELTDTVLALQEEGRGVCVVSATDADALTVSDCGIGMCRESEPTPWGAHLLCGNRLDDVNLVVESVAAAKKVSRESANLSLAGATVGAFLTLGGLRKDSTRRVKSAVNTAATIAMVNGLRAARNVRLAARMTHRDETPWHAMSPEEVLDRVGSSRSGLDDRKAARRVHPLSNGASNRPGLARAIAGELDNPLTPILGAGAAAAAGIGSVGDAAIVGAAMGLNAIVGGVERFRAERAIAALEESESREVSVRRAGRVIRIASERLVQGDILELEPSDVVPADCRILEASSVEVDESNLTGESFPVSKSVDSSFSPIVADRSSMLYEGTSIVAGETVAVVVATGDQTEAQRGLRSVRHAAKESGTEARLRAITETTLPVAIAGGALLVGGGLLRGRRVRDMAPAGVSLSIASVPEGLPLLATAAQLAASKRLSARGALVRNPAAMEALGRANVLCADKTGTLTEGKLRLQCVSDGETAQELSELDAEHKAILAASLRASPDPLEGQEPAHPTDKAVLAGGQQSNTGQEGEHDQWERTSDLPFEPSRGYHAAVGQTGRGKVLTLKGAPEVVLPMCQFTATNGDARPLREEDRKRLQDEASRLAAEGLRVLVVAERDVEEDEQIEHDHIDRLSFRGFLGLSDPVRPAAIESIKKLQSAGVSVIMITGDHPDTARSIARQLGLAKVAADDMLLGPNIDLMDDPTLDQAIEHVSVVARATPAQKVRIVEALQRVGRTVAMTGDGANDAPAIRLADVGIALGSKSTSAARSAADLIVVDGRIETIVDAIVEGRAMWTSVRDAISILIGGNLGEIAYTVASGLLTTESPLNARQLMLVNLLTDVAPSMSVAVQPPKEASSDSLLQAGPSAALGKTLTHDILWRAMVTSGSAFAAWLFTSLYDKKGASTVGLLSLVGSQLGQTIALGGREKGVLKASLGSAAVLLVMVQTPQVSRLVGSRPVGPVGLLTATGASVASAFLAKRGPRSIPYLESYLEEIVAKAEKRHQESRSARAT